jgi:hypothetical protein
MTAALPSRRTCGIGGRRSRLAGIKDLPVLDRLEQAGGRVDAVPSADGWELVLAENVAYLVDDQRRWQALAAQRRAAGTPRRSLARPGWAGDDE